MLIILKIIHIAALMAGAAAGVGNGIMVRRVIASGEAPPPLMAGTMRTLGLIGPVAILVLWLSGLAIVFLVLGPGSLGWAFWVKLLGASVALLGAALAFNTSRAAARTGQPPDLKRLKGLGNMIWSGVIIAVVFAVIEFS